MTYTKYKESELDDDLKRRSVKIAGALIANADYVTSPVDRMDRDHDTTRNQVSRSCSSGGLLVCEALDFMAATYRRDIARLSRRIVELEFPEVTPSLIFYPRRGSGEEDARIGRRVAVRRAEGS
jgi:hypothetical protein